MTLARTKDNLLESLADKGNRVIALSGKWGTGKTHLWTEVQGASTDDAVKKAVSVSLFGVNSISDLKLKIAQKLLPQIGEGGIRSESIKNGVAGMRKVLTALHKGFSALDELALIATPMMMKGRVIVIDDIERKHEKLSIDEILGFIDDCVQNLNCRILIILNSDQLGDKEIWELFREKVIDQELRLETSPHEAFDIAVSLTPTDHAVELKKAIDACKVVNIRIIRKVIKVTNRLLASHGRLAPRVVSRVVPSITILSAIHYKALEDGPSFEFVLKFESTFMAMMARDAEKKGENGTPEAQSRERWRLLFDEMGFRGADEFEALVVDFLKSGLIDAAAVGKIIDRYVAEGEILEAREQAHALSDRVTWHPEVTDAQLLDEFRALIPTAGLLDMFTVTSLHYQAGTVLGGATVGDEIIQAWVSAFRAKHPAGQEPRFDPDFNFFHKPLHPDIEAEIKAVQARTQSTSTLIEVCRRVAEDRSWGTREEVLMQTVTPAGYEAAILAASGRDLRLLLLQSVDFVKNPATYEPHFRGGLKAFTDACRNISTREPTSRIGNLVRTLFADAKLESLIMPPVAAVVISSPTVGAAVRSSTRV